MVMGKSYVITEAEVILAMVAVFQQDAENALTV